MILHNGAVTYRLLGKIEKAPELFEDVFGEGKDVPGRRSS